MPKNINPLNPDQLRASLDQNDKPENPSSVGPSSNTDNTPQSSNLPPAIDPELSRHPSAFNQESLNGSSNIQQPTGFDQDERKRKRYKIINLIILCIVVIAVCLAGWYFWVKPNKESGKTILGTADETTLAGLNKENTRTLPDGTTYRDPKKPINIPPERQTYSLENGEYKYSFDFLKGSEINEYSDVDFQDIITPAGSYTLTALIEPSKKQEKLVCEKRKFLYEVKTVTVFGQDYPLCGNNKDRLSSYYYLNFYHLDTWHNFSVGHLNHGVFTEQLPQDILNSLKVEKL